MAYFAVKGTVRQLITSENQLKNALKFGLKIVEKQLDGTLHNVQIENINDLDLGLTLPVGGAADG